MMRFLFPAWAFVLLIFPFVTQVDLSLSDDAERHSTQLHSPHQAFPLAVDASHPLDSALDACMTAGDRLTYDSWLCCLQYTQLWEAEIAHLYKLLLTQSNTDFEEDRLLTKAQKNWVKFKNAQYAYIDRQYRGDDGTMYERRREWERFEIVRERGLMLYAHYIGMSGDR
jgi:uncharacterized protein YecT (DUF1311 family)